MQDLEAPKYEDDFYSWSVDQADRLRELQSELGTGISGVDFENLIEEVESLGRQERHTLASYLQQVIIHLCLIAYAPKRKAQKNVNHWLSEIGIFRENILRVLDDSPGLKGRLDDLCGTEWRRAREVIILKTQEMGEFSSAQVTKMRRQLKRQTPPTSDEILGFDWQLHKHRVKKSVSDYNEESNEPPRFPAFVKDVLDELKPQPQEFGR